MSNAPVPVLLYTDAHPQTEIVHHRVDVDALLASKLLITGGSGSGKSRALRALLEQLAGQLPLIVFDFEGDLVTLTEVHPFLVAGDGGHLPAHPAQAAALATRVLALKASLICNLSELVIEERQAFVAAFLQAMMAAPRDHWGRCLIAIDEVQLVCPERTDGDPVSAAAVVDVAARGRKRGYGLVVTSQRVTKIRKDLVAECHSRLFGFITLPADVAAAGKELGLEGRARADLKQLGRGEFFAIGPAFARETVRVRNADVRTKEPASGQGATLPSSASIDSLLQQIGPLPIPASTNAPLELVQEPGTVYPIDEERLALAGMRARLREIVSQRFDLRARVTELEAQQAALRLEQMQLDHRMGDLDHALGDLARHADGTPSDEPSGLGAAAEDGQTTETRTVLMPSKLGSESGEEAGRTLSTEGGVPRHQPEPSDPSAPRVNKTMRAMLAALAQLADLTRAPVDRVTLAAWVGMSPRSGTFANYLSTLKQAGYIETASAGVGITPDGRRVAGPRLFTSRAELHRHWLAKLGKTPAAMLQQLIRRPSGIARADLAKAVGVSPASGTYANYLSELRRAGLITTDGGNVKATALLFPRGLA